MYGMKANLSVKYVKTRKQGLAVILFMMIIGMTIGMMSAKEAYAKEEKTITGLGTGAIDNPSSSGGGWSYVYYGQYNGLPMRYRVLTNNTSLYGDSATMLLDCDNILFDRRMDEHCNQWKDTALKRELNEGDESFLKKAFTDVESAAIASSIKAAGETVRSHYGVDMSGAELTGEKIFVLEAADAKNGQYGYVEDINRVKYPKEYSQIVDPEYGFWFWWLRSPYMSKDYDNLGTFVWDDGLVSWANVANINVGVSPAFNVDLSSVISSTLLSGDAGSAGAEYKLTLLDQEISVDVDSDHGVEKNGSDYTIVYSINGNHKENVTQVSIVVTDGVWSDAGWSNGAGLKQYTKLEGISGEVTFSLNDNITGIWGKDYHVYLLAEDVKEGVLTDYAAAPVEIISMDTQNETDPDGESDQKDQTGQKPEGESDKMDQIKPKPEGESAEKDQIKLKPEGRTGAEEPKSAQKDPAPRTSDHTVRSVYILLAASAMSAAGCRILKDRLKKDNDLRR